MKDFGAWRCMAEGSKGAEGQRGRMGLCSGSVFSLSWYLFGVKDAYCVVMVAADERR